MGKRIKLSLKPGVDPSRPNIGIVAGELAQHAFALGARYDANTRFEAGRWRAEAERIFGSLSPEQSKLFEESFAHQLRQLGEQTGFAFAKERSPLKLLANAKHSPPAGAVAYTVDEVLAGAYAARGYERASRSHAVYMDAADESIGEKTVCNKLELHKLAGMSSADPEPTCEVCLARIKASGLPRSVSDGPFLSNGSSPALTAARDIDYFAQYMGGYDVEVEPAHEIPHRERYTVQVWQRGRPHSHATLMGQFWVYDDHIMGWRSAADMALGQYVKELSAKLGEVQTEPEPYRRASAPSQAAAVDRLMREDERAMKRYASGIRREESRARKLKRNDGYSPFAEQDVSAEGELREQCEQCGGELADMGAHGLVCLGCVEGEEMEPNSRSRHREGDELVMGMTVKSTGPWLSAGTPVRVLEVKKQRGQAPRLLVRALNPAEQSYKLEYWVDESAIESYGANGMHANHAVVLGTGIMLHAKMGDGDTVVLEERTTHSRKLWRVVKTAEVEQAAREWAELHGIEYTPNAGLKTYRGWNIAQPNSAGTCPCGRNPKGWPCARCAPSIAYYVWPLTRENKPLVGEGPWGPYWELRGAKTFARIGATEGKHDRAVTVGCEPSSPSFKIVRVYSAGTGERRV